MPVGSWTNTLTGTLNGQAGGSPQTTTECSSQTAAAQVDRMSKAMRFSMANCTVTVSVDTPARAVYAQECPIEWHVKTTLTRIDDRHFTSDILFTQGQLVSTTHIDGHYNGPCTPTAVSPPVMPDKLPAEACAQIAEAHTELAHARVACDSMEEEAARCRVRLDSELKRLEIQDTLCRQ